MADLRNYVQGQDYTLAGSGCSLTATSIVATSLTLPNSGELITMTMFGTTGFATLEPETEREENISFTGITQNVNGTATLTGVTRGLGLVAPYTQDTTLRHSHAGSTIFRFTNSVQFYDSLANKYNDETVSGVWTYATGATPIITDQPSTNTMAANKLYVDTVGNTKQIGIQFEDEGSNLGASGTATEVDFTGAGVTASRSSNKVTVNIPFVAGSGPALSTNGTPNPTQSVLNLKEGANIDIADDGVGGITITGTTPVVDIQTFTASGTYTKPSGAKTVEVVCIGAGGGGGSGGASSDNTNMKGGGGGGGGAVSRIILPASSVGSTETVTVGAGGTGGASVAPPGVGTTVGLPGTNGTASSFGTWAKAGGGGLGEGGTSGNCNGGAGASTLNNAAGTTGGSPTVSGNSISGQGSSITGTGAVGGCSEWGGPGGGGSAAAGGSSVWATGAGGGGGTPGGAGGTVQSYATGGGGAGGVGGATPTAGTAGSPNSTLLKGYGGSGGGGGGDTTTVGQNGKVGGAGGTPGGGGGGGGSSSKNSQNDQSGAGGDGGRGEVRVYTYF